MGVFEDFSRFLEARLEEFLRNNPHLELQALEEQLREQEAETLRLLASLRLREKQLESEILATAQEVQRWHVRIQKAKAAQRFDLLKPAEEREAQLLRHGNQLWGQMKGVKDRIQQSVVLHQRIQERRREVKSKIAEAEAARTSARTQQQTPGWGQTSSAPSSFQNPAYRAAADPLERTFQEWETEDELEQMKRDMRR